jgi:hypothetical protein
MNLPLSINELATRLEAMGLHVNRDDTRYHPLKVLAPSGDSLAGFRYERGEWKYCLAFDATLEANGIDKSELETILLSHSSPV